MRAFLGKCVEVRPSILRFQMKALTGEWTQVSPSLSAYHHILHAMECVYISSSLIGFQLKALIGE